MKNFLKATVSILMLCMFITITFAQDRGQGQRRMDASQFQPIGKVSGKVIDSKTNEPIEYANVIIHRWKDSTVAYGTISNSEGFFQIDKIMNGRYFMKVSYIGYSTKRFDSLNVSPNKNSFSYQVKLNQKMVNMGEVVVRSEKENTNYNLDKKVYNVDQGLANSGASAVEVVQNIPSVSVDADGGVSVRGNSNITVLIDGRPAQLAGFSGSDVLAQIPASQIESIELVTNPSARYDPEGTGGIINVILKKRSNLGINGRAMANVGSRGRYNASLNANLKSDDYNIFGSYDARVFKFRTEGGSIRNSFFGTASNILDQTSVSDNDNLNHSINLGADYYLADREYVTLSGQFRFGGGDNTSSIDNKNLVNTSDLQSQFVRTTEGTRDNSSGNYTLSYKKTWSDKVQELTADLMYSTSSMNSDSKSNQYYLYNLSTITIPDILQRSLSDNTNDMFLLQANYVQPLASWGRIETGFRSMFRDLKMANDYQDYNFITQSWGISNLQNNLYDYKEQLHALYAIYANSFGNFSFQFGGRAEKSVIDGSIPLKNQNYTSDYFDVYPSAHFRYNFSELDELALSYSRRIDRPNNRQLNPYEDRSDSLNIIKGNPNLKPQYHNSLELGYTTFIDRTALVANLFYRENTNLISTISTLNEKGVSYSTYENVSKGSSYGLEFIATQPISDWARLNGSFSYYNNSVEDMGSLGGTRSGDSWRVMLNSQFTISQGFVLQSMLFYNSPSIQMMIGGFGRGFGGGGGGGMRGGGGGDFGGGMFMGGASSQSKIKELYWMDLMLRKEFFDGQLTLTIRASDIFNTRKFDTETIGSNFTIISKRLMDSRTINVGISYSLNSRNRMMEQERERRIEEGYDEL